MFIERRLKWRPSGGQAWITLAVYPISAAITAYISVDDVFSRPLLW
jgi:hypothetical protein